MPADGKQAPSTHAPEGAQSVSVVHERRTHWLALQSKWAGQSVGAVHDLGTQCPPLPQTNPVPSP